MNRKEPFEKSSTNKLKCRFTDILSKLKCIPIRYQCPHCEKKFRSHSVYQNHLRVHTGLKEFVCTYCGKAFMQKSHLKRHIATHTGERNHACPGKFSSENF